MKYQELATALGYTFKDESLLEAALTHRSYAHEHGLQDNDTNERLEFLGDAMLNFITGNLLFDSYPQHGEGDLTVLRAALVQTRTLAQFARQLNLQPFIRVSKGEHRSGARKRDNLLADTFEALIAAISLDGGLEAAQTFVEPLLLAELQRIEAGSSVVMDYKTPLQQRIQGALGITPQYKTIHVEGPDHHRIWTIQVWIADVQLGTGIGSSKQQASQAAAQEALETLDGPTPPLLPPKENE